MDVIQLLKKDHKKVKKLFEEYENLSGRAAQKKPDLVAQIKQALEVHAQVEEELVYPAFQEQRSMKTLINEALEEHHVAKMLLAELDALQSDDEHRDAKIKVLCEYVTHHVKEEEKEIFPQAQKRLSAKNLATLGEQVEARQQALMGEMEGDEMGEHDMEGMQDEMPEAMQAEGRKAGGMKSQRGGRRAA